MVVQNSLQGLWQSGQSALNAWVSLTSEFSAEIATHSGFDAVTIDLQHGLADISQLPTLLAGVKAEGVTPVVRVPWLDAGDIMRCLDLGALGVICPMINTPKQAAEFASYALYPPEGVRSNGPIRASLVCEGDYGKQANAMITRFAMIETREAVANAEAILSTPGIDAYYLGPSDLARSYGYPAKLDHQGGELYDIIVSLKDLAHRLGKKAGIHCGTIEYAQQMRDIGYDFVTGWADAVSLKNSAGESVASFRKTKGAAAATY
jgi:4-hydroxy-2-oxoheptanedioate aldolase